MTPITRTLLGRPYLHLLLCRSTPMRSRPRRSPRSGFSRWLPWVTFIEAFEAGLRDLGLVKGQNVAMSTATRGQAGTAP